MKHKKMILIGLILALLVASLAAIASAGGGGELAQVRAVAAQFRRTEAAQAAGYDLVPGLDYCFENPGVGAMGYHYINVAMLDLSLDPLHPEAMVYATGPGGHLKLGAVEYIVPAAEWNAAGNTEPPMVLDHHLHLNEALGVYVLHAWVWRNNPAGMFEDWNPNVSCP
ncbi:MAG: hypothetical protein KJ069_30380 [Anaerolineae bacterium]|nr:hypothetical protein [Anaerolineae bacterium]